MDILIPITSIIMAGLFLSVVGWQVLSIGKAAMLNKTGISNEEIEELRKRIQSLESKIN